MRCCSLLVLLWAVALLWNPRAVAAAYRPKPETRPTYTAKEDQLEGLPDIGHPATRSKLECSACRCLVEQVNEDLEALYTLRHGRPKHYEVVDALEDTCGKIKGNYGLLMRNNHATAEFSRDEKITRMKGSWINTFIEGRCGEIMGHHEEAIEHHFPRMRGRLADLQQLVCTKLDRKCAGTAFTHEEL